MGKLSSLIKDLELDVVEVSDESTPDTVVYKVTIKDEITVKGSNVLSNGKPMVMSTKEVFIAADNIEVFEEHFNETTKKYKGKLKLDISKPNGRIVNGEFVVTKPPRAWLVVIPFSKAGQNLVNDRRASLNKVITDLFGGGAISAGEPTTTTTTSDTNVYSEAVEMATPTGG